MLHFAHAHANCTRLLDRRVEPGDEARMYPMLLLLSNSMHEIKMLYIKCIVSSTCHMTIAIINGHLEWEEIMSNCLYSALVTIIQLS